MKTYTIKVVKQKGVDVLIKEGKGFSHYELLGILTMAIDELKAEINNVNSKPK